MGIDFRPMLDAIERTARAAIKIEEGDYIQDGLLYCHKCGTPKQCRISFMGQERTPFCLCKCGKEQRDREDEEQRRREQFERVEQLRRMGFPDAEMQGCTFDRDDGANEKVSSIARKYCENFREMKARGKGLLFFGTVGTGKSYMAACIANNLIDRGYPCLVTNFARLVNTIQGMFEGKQQYLDNLSQFDLLIIDDLAAERDTEFMQETVTNIIDARYRSGLPMIVTTNLTAEELKNPVDVRKSRIYSRLLEMCVPIEVSGRDRRREMARENRDDLAALLGL